MNLTLIAAMAENRVIGKDNSLIWHLPKDLKHFKDLTKGHHIIMGRKTYESMGKPLPHRTNIVVTTKENYEAPGCIIVHTLRDAIQKAEGDSQPYIIGGGKIYQQALEYADAIELTVVHETFEGDTFFPDFNTDNWKKLNQEDHPKDDKHAYSFSFLTYQKL